MSIQIPLLWFYPHIGTIIVYVLNHQPIKNKETEHGTQNNAIKRGI